MKTRADMAERRTRIVAQICNLLYRRIAFCRAFGFFEAIGVSGASQITNLRYSRLQICATIGLLLCTALPFAHAQTADEISRIRDEGLNHSQAMEPVSHLTETICQRLTGSPNLKRANEWTRDLLAAWGLTNAQREP